MSSSAGSAVASVSVISGPTAAGKSELALALAEREGAVIISADSRQIYRGFDIGTAKPTREERARVPHRGIDVVDATRRYSAAAWAGAARAWLADAAATGREAVIVGGTGFYLRALFEPLFDSLDLDPARRAALEPVLARLSTEDLRRWCASLDPPRAHLGRAQLLRAVETALLTGERLSELHRRRARARDLRPRYLIVDPGAALAERIARRIDAMFTRGWAEEVRGLLESVPAAAPAWTASGYGTVRDLVRGTIDRSMARERVLIETRQYAKRQRTWFRHQLPSDAVTLVDPVSRDAEAVVRDWWARRERA